MRASAPDSLPAAGSEPPPGSAGLPPLREEHELPDGRYLLAYWRQPRQRRPEPEQDPERA